MQQEILDQICAGIYTDINGILLKHKSCLLKKSTHTTIQNEVLAYLNTAFLKNIVNVIPEVNVEITGSDVVLRFYDSKSGNLIDSLDQIVKMPVSWSVGEDKVN